MAIQPSEQSHYLPNTLTTRCFNLCSKIGLLSLLIFFALQHIFVIMHDLPYVFHTYQHITLHYGIGHYSDITIPLTPWLYLTGKTPSLNISAFLAVLNSLCTAILLIFTWLLSCATGQKHTISFAAGLVLLSGVLSFLLPYVTLDSLIFAIITVATLICLYKGWIKHSAPVWLTTGFILTGLTGLINGLIGLIIPLFSSIFFLFWRGTFRRAGGYDGALGFGLMLITLLGGGSLIASMDNGHELITALITHQIVEPFNTIIQLQTKNWWKPIVITSLIWLPWTLIIPFIPWTKIYTIPYKILQYRSTNPGQGWLWITSFITLLYMIFIATPDPLSIMLLYPLLSILTAQGILSLSTKKSILVYITICIYFLLMGLSLGVIALYPLIQSWLPESLKTFFPSFIQSFFINTQGIAVISASCIILSIILLKFIDKHSPSGCLIIITLCSTLLAFPISYYTTSISESYPPAIKEKKRLQLLSDIPKKQILPAHPQITILPYSVDDDE